MLFFFTKVLCILTNIYLLFCALEGMLSHSFQLFWHLLAVIIGNVSALKYLDYCGLEIKCPELHKILTTQILVNSNKSLGIQAQFEKVAMIMV